MHFEGEKCISEVFLWALSLSSFWQVWFSGSQRGDGHCQQLLWPSPYFSDESCGRVWAVCPAPTIVLLQKPGYLGVLNTAAGKPCPAPAAKCELPLTETEQVFRESSATFVVFILLLINRAPRFAISAAGIAVIPKLTYLGCCPQPHASLWQFLSRERRTLVSCWLSL